MEFKNLLKAQNRDELRQWLTENHSKESECWGIVKRGRPIDSETFWYIDAVEEALCFGWIDSTTKRLKNGVAAQRLSPRRKGSLWSELNKERCRRMERLGRMTDAGRAVLPDMSEKGFILISIKNIFYPLALSNAHDGITRKVVDCLAETVYHLFQCSKYLIAKSSGS